MKTTSNNQIKTQHVYSENNTKKVYLKVDDETWFPINFQWIPIIKLNNELNLKTNKMKKLVILPLILLSIIISSCSKDSLTGSGELTSELRNVVTFTKISSEGVFEVNITQGDSQTVEIIADDNIMSKVITKVVDNELRLYLDEDTNYKNISLQANITVPVINGLKNSGTGNVLILNVDTNTDFNVYNSGTGDISIEGSAKSLTLKNEGDGTFEGFLFSVDDCNIKIIGSGDCKVNCDDYLNVQIEGSGDVYYLGTPIIEADISGSGKVINAN